MMKLVPFHERDETKYDDEDDDDGETTIFVLRWMMDPRESGDGEKRRRTLSY